MSKSPLATVFVDAHPSNYTKGRNTSIKAITVHHMAGRCTAQRCGEFWQDPARNASSTYGIGYNGEIGCYLDEKDTPWTNSNWASNSCSVTIEVANEYKGGDWKITDASLASLIKLIADIAIRNNLGTLVKGQNLTWHSMFANTNCPGPYILSKLDYIIAEANKIITGGNPAPAPIPTELKYKVGDVVYIEGPLFVSSNAAEASGFCDGKSTEVTRVNPGSAHPYNTTGDLGWMDESSLSEIHEEPENKDTIEPGDIVVVNGVGNGSSSGTSRSWTRKYFNHKMKVIKVKPGTAYPYACNQYGEGTPNVDGDVTAWFTANSVSK